MQFILFFSFSDEDESSHSYTSPPCSTSSDASESDPEQFDATPDVTDPDDGKDDEDSGNNDGTPGKNPSRHEGDGDVRDGKGGQRRRVRKKTAGGAQRRKPLKKQKKPRDKPRDRKKSSLPFHLTDEGLKLELFTRGSFIQQFCTVLALHRV